MNGVWHDDVLMGVLEHGFCHAVPFLHNTSQHQSARNENSDRSSSTFYGPSLCGQHLGCQSGSVAGLRGWTSAVTPERYRQCLTKMPHIAASMAMLFVLACSLTGYSRIWLAAVLALLVSWELVQTTVIGL